MRTRCGVYYNLNHSTYRLHLDETNITFIFSSDSHLVKFQEQYKEHREEFNTRLKGRYKLNVDFKIYADIVLYKKIESRGFMIINEGGKKLCLENLILNGEKVMMKL